MRVPKDLSDRQDWVLSEQVVESMCYQQLPNRDPGVTTALWHALEGYVDRPK